jgi:hypothetical protein
LVADELATTTGEDRRAAGEACPLLLASAGGRTSESATVRSDAGPDRAATATDGIESWWPRQQRNLATAGLGRGEVLQKWAGIWGNFGLCWCGWQAVWSAPVENHFTALRISETGVLWCRFRDQKGNSGLRATLDQKYRCSICRVTDATRRSHSASTNKTLSLGFNKLGKASDG